jgi:hypothetical protein
MADAITFVCSLSRRQPADQLLISKRGRKVWPSPLRGASLRADHCTTTTCRDLSPSWRSWMTGSFHVVADS